MPQLYQPAAARHLQDRIRTVADIRDENGNGIPAGTAGVVRRVYPPPLGGFEVELGTNAGTERAVLYEDQFDVVGWAE